MTHQQFKEIIIRYISGRTSRNEKQRLDDWLQQIEDQSLQTKDIGEFHKERERIYANLKLHITSTSRRKVSFAWSAIAASVVLLMASLGIYFLRYPILDVIDPIAVKKITASPFEVRKIILPDSSIAILNGGSSIEYPERFRGKRREVILNGKSFFDIKKDPSHPFRINSGELQVQVLGTSFVVTDYGKDSVVAVTVRTGRVSVSSSGNDLGVLLPQQDIRYNKSALKFDFHQGVEADILWTKNRFSFHETKLGDVIDLVAREYGLSIKFENPQMLEKTFTGSFEQTDSPQNILEIISMSYGWIVERHEGDYIISAAPKE